MKTVQVNTTDISGGAARAAYRLHKGLLGLGIEDSMLARIVKSSDDTIQEVSDSKIRPVRITETRPCELIQRVYIDRHRTAISNTIFTFPYPGLDISHVPLIRDADIINLHWVTYFLSLTTVHRLFSLSKPVVWTLHDQWPFTGGCHYSAGCTKYSIDCAACPQLADDRYGLPSAVLKDKLELFAGADLTIVTPSRWLGRLARESAVFKKCRVEVIPNAIETDIFYPVQKPEAKRALGIPEDGVAVLFCAEIGNELRKGFRLLVDALRECAIHPDLRNLIAEGKFVLLCIGKPNDEVSSLGVPVQSLGLIDSDDTMRTAYSAADLFVLPSLEDNLPNTMLESMACGTPVVAFDVGGMPDMVSNGVTGATVPMGNTAEMAEAMAGILLNPDLRRHLADNCRKMIETGYTLKVQAERYASLYKELISSSCTGKEKRADIDTEYLAAMDYSFGPNTETIYKGLVRTAFLRLSFKEKMSRVIDGGIHLYNYVLNRVYQLLKPLVGK